MSQGRQIGIDGRERKGEIKARAERNAGWREGKRERESKDTEGRMERQRRVCVALSYLFVSPVNPYPQVCAFHPGQSMVKGRRCETLTQKPFPVSGAHCSSML